MKSIGFSNTSNEATELIRLQRQTLEDKLKADKENKIKRQEQHEQDKENGLVVRNPLQNNGGSNDLRREIYEVSNTLNQYMFAPRTGWEYVMPAHNPHIPTAQTNAFVDVNDDPHIHTAQPNAFDDANVDPDIDANIGTSGVEEDKPEKEAVVTPKDETINLNTVDSVSKKNKKNKKKKDALKIESEPTAPEQFLLAPVLPAPVLPDPVSVLKDSGVDPEKRTRAKSQVVMDVLEQKIENEALTIKTNKISTLNKAQLIAWINHKNKKLIHCYG